MYLSSYSLIHAVMRHSDIIRETPLHHHTHSQLLGAEQGLLTVDAQNYHWVVPATHAVWIPPDIPHALRSHGLYSGWSVYVAGAACERLPTATCVLSIFGLLREAVRRKADIMKAGRTGEYSF